MKDQYHPHYPSADNDLFERLCTGAHLKANPFRLLFYRYTPEQETIITKLYQDKTK